MIILSVATHNERMINIFRSSCEKNDCKLQLLAFGEQWRGFGWRWNVINAYLSDNKIDKNEIILITDAFDSCILKNETEIINRFKQFKSPMVFSCEPTANKFHPLSAYYRWRVFGPDPIINGGSYIGYAGAIKKFISRIKYKNNTDDQRFLTSLFKHIKMTIDYDHKIFYHHCGWMKTHIKGIIPDTCVITFPGSGYTNELLNSLGYDTDELNLLTETCKEKIQVAIRRIKHYVPFFWREILVIMTILAGAGMIPLILGIIV